MNYKQFNQLIDNNDNILIIFFTSNLFNKLNKEISVLQKTYKNILTIDVDLHDELIFNLNIKSIPFFYIYKKNTIIEEILGNYKNISDIIKIHL